LGPSFPTIPTESEVKPAVKDGRDLATLAPAVATSASSVEDTGCPSRGEGRSTAGPSVPEQRRIVVVSGTLESPEIIHVAERLKDS
jgi:hypothetical protein